MAKIEAKKQDVQEIVGEDEIGANLPEELVIHYQQIGHALENYRSGKMPKVVNIKNAHFKLHLSLLN